MFKTAAELAVKKVASMNWHTVHLFCTNNVTGTRVVN